MTDQVSNSSEYSGTNTKAPSNEERIDRINLLDFARPNSAPEKVLYSCTIQDAASNYLFAFLGKNGTNPEEFYAAWKYFFKITSYDKNSWNHNRNIKHIYKHQGLRVVENHYLTDSEIKLMCFDQHYEMSGLADHMHIDKFRQKLRDKRKRIVNNNWEQISANVSNLYSKELSQIPNGQQIPLRVWTGDPQVTLVDPPTPQHLASLIYVPNKLKRTPKVKAKRQKELGVYAKLAEKLQSNTFTPLGDDWGPFAALL